MKHAHNLEHVNPILGIQKPFEELPNEENSDLRKRFKGFLLKHFDGDGPEKPQQISNFEQANILYAIFEVVSHETQVAKDYEQSDPAQLQSQRLCMLQLAKVISRYFCRITLDNSELIKKAPGNKETWESFFTQINELPKQEGPQWKSVGTLWFHLAEHYRSDSIYKTWIKFGGEPHLGLPALIDDKIPNYLIVSAPMASSGDIYHVAAWLMLLRFQRSLMPNVLLTYDTGSNEKSVPTDVSKVKTFHHAQQRAKGFLEGLGFADKVTVRDISAYRSSASYVKAREKDLKSFMKDHYPNQIAFDQRATTTLLSWVAKEFGKDYVTCTIREQLTFRHHNYFNPQEIERIQHYGLHVKEQLTIKYPTQKFIVIHLRRSSGKGANSDQELPSGFISGVVDWLGHKGMGTVLVYADSRQRFSGYKDTPYFAPFSNKQSGGNISIRTNDTQIDLAKFFHVELLLQLFKFPNCKGIVGNTSGTLDIATFMGHKVFNIHVFDTLPKIDYQDYRLLMQVVFMSVAAQSDWNIATVKRTAAASQNPNQLLTWMSTWLSEKSESNPLENKFLRPADMDKNEFLFFRKLFHTNNGHAADNGKIPVWDEVAETVSKSGVFKGPSA